MFDFHHAAWHFDIWRVNNNKLLFGENNETANEKWPSSSSSFQVREEQRETRESLVLEREENKDLWAP